MMISEYNFSWLHEAEEERLLQELERRRVIAERLETERLETEQLETEHRDTGAPRSHWWRRSGGQTAAGRVPAGGTI
jgi:hypothetical protein